MITVERIETRFFDFETDFVSSLKCIPMIVRYKLDTCRIKLKLPDWVKMSFEEKEELAWLPCYRPDEIARYADYVNELAFKYSNQYPSILSGVDDQWSAPLPVPTEVTDKAAEWECESPTADEWALLHVFERFALVKLSRSGHEGKNFPRALMEFRRKERAF